MPAQLRAHGQLPGEYSAARLSSPSSGALAALQLQLQAVALLLPSQLLASAQATALPGAKTRLTAAMQLPACS